MNPEKPTRSLNPLRANWLNVTTVIVAFIILTGGIVLLSMGGSFWLITNHSSLTFITWIILGAGSAGGYLMNKHRGERRSSERD